MIHGLTMPGFGTTHAPEPTPSTSWNTWASPPRPSTSATLALQAFQEIGHAPFGIELPRAGCRIASGPPWRKVPREARRDLTFENVQARLRTFLLMSRGFVVGTGDLSELALGWSTYNADHMSMYNPNCSIPKTLVKFLVRYVAMNEFPEGPVRETLLSIVDNDDLSRAAAGIVRG